MLVSNPKLMFENLNAGRLERYFWFSNYFGTAKLGIGPEAERANETNIYEPVWVSQDAFTVANVVPQEIKVKVLELWRCGNLQ